MSGPSKPEPVPKEDGIIGRCPLVAPSSFTYSSWDGVSTDWGYRLQPSRPIFDLLRSSPEEQHFLSKWLRPGQIRFAFTRGTTRTLAQNTKWI